MAILRDLHNNIAVESALNTAAISSNTTTVGNIVDLSGDEAVEFIVQAGTITDGTYDVLVEEGDDSGLSDAANVADTELLGTEAAIQFVAAEDNAVEKIGYRGAKRYVRLSLVSTGVTTGGTFGGVAVRRPLTRGTTG